MNNKKIPHDTELDASGAPLNSISESKLSQYNVGIKLHAIMALAINAGFAIFTVLSYQKIGFINTVGFIILSVSALGYQLPRLFSSPGNRMRADRRFTCCYVLLVLLAIGSIFNCITLPKMAENFGNGFLNFFFSWIFMPVGFNVTLNVMYHFYNEKQELEEKKREVRQ